MAFDTNFYLAIIVSGILMAIVSIAIILLLHTIRKPSDSTISYLPDGILILDPDNNIQDMNPAAEKIIGISKKKTVGKPYDLVLRTLLPHGKLDDEQHHEISLDISGQINYFDISLALVCDKNGLCNEKIITLRNITENKQTCRKLEEQLNQEIKLRAQVECELDKRARYTRAIVHELNSPLTALISSSELLEELNLDQMPASLVSNIKRASTHLEQRTAELTELARGEIGMLKIQPRKLDIHRLLEEIASEMTPVAAGKKLNLETDIPQSLPLIMGDGGRIRQVMLNLLSNAFKFTTEGKIIIRVRHDDSSLLVQVEDSGHGIDPEQMEFLFDPYRRKQGSVPRIGGGLGIGLSLCKLFIELHHGKIWVDSTPGKGTIFSFTLPVAQDHISETSDTASIKNLN